MRITRLIKRNNYVNVFFDNDEKQRMHYETAVKFGLRKNDELSEIQLKRILEAEEEFMLKDSALRVLSIRPHSTFELYTKLLKKGFSSKKITPLIDDLKQRDYLSDEDFTERYIEEGIKKKKGRHKIKAELMKKGIDRAVIEAKLSSLIDDEDILENAYELAEKKINFLLKKDYTKLQLKQKLFSYLSNKGYTFDVAQSVTDKILSDY